MENFNYIKEALTRKGGRLGKGGFGSVITSRFRISLRSDSVIEVAAKKMDILNDFSKFMGKKDQNMIENEINILNDLKNFDNKFIYFPIFYGAYNATGLIAELENQDQDNFKNEIIFLMMEKLDFNFDDYLEKLNKNVYNRTSGKFEFEYKFDNLLQTRLTIGENIATSLISIIPKYTHCDLKPANIMVRKINDDSEREALRLLNVNELELYPNKFYFLKVIDFGAAVQGSRDERKCRSGTLEYMPADGGTSQSNETYDVFSLAMIMLDFENWIENLTSFNDINAIWKKTKHL
jgi:serine/threonine protein kinase